MKDSELPERPQDERRQNGQHRGRRPFDTSELDSIPRTTEDDPPYRNWWVVADRAPPLRSRRKAD